MKRIIPAAIASGVGLVILGSYALPDTGLLPLRLIFTDWAMILAGLAVLVGVLNLLRRNFQRVQERDAGWGYSILTMLALLATLSIGVLESYGQQPALYRPETVTNLLFTNIVVASQATLAGLIGILLVVAAARMLRNKLNVWSIVFLVVIVITLVGWVPFGGSTLFLSVHEWLLTVPAVAGARGILLGVALGTVMVGLRVLSSTERPFKE